MENFTMLIIRVIVQLENFTDPGFDKILFNNKTVSKFEFPSLSRHAIYYIIIYLKCHMSKYENFQDKIFNMLSQFYQCQRVEDVGGFEHVVVVLPFQTDAADILIAKHKNTDSFIVSARVRPTSNIQKHWNFLDMDIKEEILKLIQSAYSRHNKILRADDKFFILTSSRLFLIHDLRAQELLDMIQDDIALLVEVMRILRNVDNNLQAMSKEPKHDMFR